MEKFAIVGIGLVDSLGSDVSENWVRYINGETGIKEISNFDLTEYPAIKITHAAEIDESVLDISKYFSDAEKRHFDRYDIIGFYAAAKAIESCNIKNPPNTAIVFSSLGGGALSTLKCTEQLLNGKRSTPRQCMASQRDYLSGLISRKFGFLGASINITSACASGIMALDYATKLLKDGDYEQVVVGACDVTADPMDIYMFQCIGALDTRNPAVSMPFDKDRNGFVMGEGAAVYVVKRLETAIAHGDNILAVIRGIGYASEAYHDTSVHPDGIGGRTAIEMAVKKAEIKYSNIDIVNVHATSTPNGDEIEYEIINDYFSEVPVMALKANLGHSIAASALVELSYLIQSLNNSCIGPIPTLNNPIGDGIKLPKNKLIGDFKIGLKNSFGFGGKCAAIIVEKYDGNQ